MDWKFDPESPKTSNGQNPFYSVCVVIVEDLVKFCSNKKSRPKYCHEIPPRSDHMTKIMFLRVLMEGCRAESAP